MGSSPLSLIMRMTILRMLLFLFQCLPLEIPNSTCKKNNNKWLSSSMWQNKRSRVLLKNCFKKKTWELKFTTPGKNHWAAQLKSMVAWLSQDKDTILVGMEQSDFPIVYLDIIPFLNRNVWRENKLSNQGVITVWIIKKSGKQRS